MPKQLRKLQMKQKSNILKPVQKTILMLRAYLFTVYFSYLFRPFINLQVFVLVLISKTNHNLLNQLPMQEAKSILTMEARRKSAVDFIDFLNFCLYFELLSMCDFLCVLFGWFTF